MRQNRTMYKVYDSHPNDGRPFVGDFLEALGQGQILLHILPGNRWNFYLAPYTLGDWTRFPDRQDYSAWYAWNEEHLGLDGTWEAVKHLKLSPQTELQRRVSRICFRTDRPVDVRIQPMGRVLFGVVRLKTRSRDRDRVVRFLNESLGGEHRAVLSWDQVPQRHKEKLCQKVTADHPTCLEKLDASQDPLYVLQTLSRRSDWVGGHSNILELMSCRDRYPNLDWPELVEKTNQLAFLREMTEELGLEPLPHPPGRKQALTFVSSNQNVKGILYLSISQPDVQLPVMITVREIQG